MFHIVEVIVNANARSEVSRRSGAGSRGVPASDAVGASAGRSPRILI